jgi:CDP-paratose 2-epimerase
VATAIVTGSGGLIGSESVQYFVEQGLDVVGLENDMRSRFFGPHASTRPVSERLAERYRHEFRWLEIDIRDADAVTRVFAEHAKELELIIHTAAQPSHDWAASDPQTDFGVNANGTLNLLEATRQRKPDATFVFCSTNKVYGDLPNYLPLEERDTRLELPRDHAYYEGIPTSMSIDHSMHSLFGVSKAAADLMVQEYGRYFDIPTVCFRGGCLTGPNHAGAQLHGFLAYLLRCAVTGDPYTVFGYGAKQVRDNIHSADVVSAFAEFHRTPKTAAVYNLGGGRASNCSMLEAIELCEQIAGRELIWELSGQARMGDHRWWISDLREFEGDYPDWKLQYDVEAMLRESYERNVEQWTALV